MRTVVARAPLDPTAAGRAPAVEVPTHEPHSPWWRRGRRSSSPVGAWASSASSSQAPNVGAPIRLARRRAASAPPPSPSPARPNADRDVHVADLRLLDRRTRNGRRPPRRYPPTTPRRTATVLSRSPRRPPAPTRPSTSTRRLGDQTSTTALARGPPGSPALDDDRPVLLQGNGTPGIWPTTHVGSATWVLMTLCNIAVVYADPEARLQLRVGAQQLRPPGSIAISSTTDDLLARGHVESSRRPPRTLT